MFLGVHCSVRNGYQAALEEALALRVDAMQILPYPRHHEPSPAELESFARARRGSSVRKLLVHSRYLPALSITEPRRRAGSQGHLLRELSYARALGADAFVLHMGAYSPGSSFNEGVALFAEAFARAKEAGHTLPVLIENVPGGGRRMGGTRAELEAILAALRTVWPECGLCWDTAHAWAAGEPPGEGHEIKAWHLNDTLAEPGSNMESHWHLGQGRLGDSLAGLLRRLANTETVVILETPKEPGADARNLEWARRASGL